MIHNKKPGILSVAVSGIVLYVLASVQGILPYLNIDSNLFSVVFYGTSIGGILVCILTLCRKTVPLGESFFRSLGLILVFGTGFALDSGFGITRALYELFAVKSSTQADNVNGLLLATFFFMIGITCGTVLLIKAIIALGIRIYRNRN